MTTDCRNLFKGTIKAHFDEAIIDAKLQNQLDRCFDYFRQALVCAGDTTLEHAVVINETVIGDTDGWGIEHRCRDWNAIFNFANNNRINAGS
jgi:Mycotoxin biosynthesis protein UstYa